MVQLAKTEESLGAVRWAQRVFGHIELSDPRLVARSVQVAAHFASRPKDSIPQACGSPADTKGTYRYLENKRVTAEALIKSMAQATAAACGGIPVIYAVQDTTCFNYSTLKGTAGLGPIGDGPARGIHLHSTLALNRNGVPLGLLNLNFWTRPEAKVKVPRRQRPIEEKESFRWLQGATAVHAALAGQPVPPRIIHVADREGDIHEFFAHILRWGDGAVIRCGQNRGVAGDADRAYAAVHAVPCLGHTALELRRTAQHAARTASVEIRATRVRLQPSDKYPKRQPLDLTLVEVWEPEPPSGTERVVWRLWTTEPARTLAEALELVRIYKQRWRIEDVHLAAKSGCDVEDLQLETVPRLKKALSIYMAVAVRIVALRGLLREQPEQPCTVIFTPLEWRLLWSWKHQKPCLPDCPVPTLREAAMWLGQLGGHMGRKGDGLPGIRTLWRGWRDLHLLVEGQKLHPGLNLS
jgi:hypothetical protein